jgi:putative ABC transport system permease protein
LVARTADDPENLINAVRSEVRGIDQDQPVYNIKPMEQVVFDSVGQRFFNMFLMTNFSIVALILAAIGIYGVIAYSVAQRTQEIGIRIALGAQQRDVLKLIVGKSMIQTLIGVAIGLVAAVALTRVMASLLYGVSALDPVTFAGVSMLLIIVALFASYFPARKAANINPIVGLRE